MLAAHEQLCDVTGVQLLSESGFKPSSELLLLIISVTALTDVLDPGERLLMRKLPLSRCSQQIRLWLFWSAVSGG